MIALSADTTDYAANVRRLMAREGLSFAELMRRSGLNHRTLKNLLAGRQKPRSATLHQLANGLNVPIEELFQDPALLRHRLFDRQTNPVVEQVVADHPQLFHGWTETEFDELYSHFGTGGALTEHGTMQAASQMNRRRELISKVTLLFETNEAELLETMIEAMYRRTVVDVDNNSQHNSRRCS